MYCRAHDCWVMACKFVECYVVYSLIGFTNLQDVDKATSFVIIQ